jgi:hypothetical protein
LRFEVVAYDQAGEGGTVATDSDPADKESSGVATDWAAEENDLRVAADAEEAAATIP